MQEAVGGSLKIYDLQEYKTILANPPKFEQEWSLKIQNNSSMPELALRVLSFLQLEKRGSPEQDEEYDVNTAEALKAHFVWAKDIKIPRVTHCKRVPDSENHGKESYEWVSDGDDKVRMEVYLGTYESAVPVLLQRGVYKAGTGKIACDLIAGDVKWGIFLDREEDKCPENPASVSKSKRTDLNLHVHVC